MTRETAKKMWMSRFPHGVCAMSACQLPVTHRVNMTRLNIYRYACKHHAEMIAGFEPKLRLIEEFV